MKIVAKVVSYESVDAAPAAANVCVCLSLGCRLSVVFCVGASWLKRKPRREGQET